MIGETVALPHVGDDRDTCTAQCVEVSAEPGLPTLDPRQAQRVAGLVAVAHVEPARGVAHRPRQAADRDGEVAVLGARARVESGRSSPSARPDR